MVLVLCNAEKVLVAANKLRIPVADIEYIYLRKGRIARERAESLQMEGVMGIIRSLRTLAR